MTTAAISKEMSERAMERLVMSCARSPSIQSDQLDALNIIRSRMVFLEAELKREYGKNAALKNLIEGLRKGMEMKAEYEK